MNVSQVTPVTESIRSVSSIITPFVSSGGVVPTGKTDCPCTFTIEAMQQAAITKNLRVYLTTLRSIKDKVARRAKRFIGEYFIVKNIIISESLVYGILTLQQF